VLHLDDALNILIGHLASLGEVKPGTMPAHGRRPYGSDVYVVQVAAAYWQTQGKRLYEMRNAGK